MQFIRTYQIFRFLFDIPVFICRNQLWADRSIYYVEQGSFGFLIHAIFRHPLYQIFHERFGYTGIDTIHGHVVTIVGCPS